MNTHLPVLLASRLVLKLWWLLPTWYAGLTPRTRNMHRSMSDLQASLKLKWFCLELALEELLCSRSSGIMSGKMSSSSSMSLGSGFGNSASRSTSRSDKFELWPWPPLVTDDGSAMDIIVNDTGRRKGLSHFPRTNWSQYVGYWIFICEVIHLGYHE